MTKNEKSTSQKVISPFFSSKGQKGIEYNGLSYEDLKRKLKRVWQRIHKTGYEKNIPVEKDWEDLDLFLEEFLPRYTWASHLSTAKHVSSNKVYTFMKRVNPRRGFTRGNFGPTLPDAASIGRSIFHSHPWATSHRTRSLFNIEGPGNSRPSPIKSLITTTEWETAWKRASLKSDAQVPSLETVKAIDPRYSRTYNDVILETKIAAKDGIFSQTLAKNYLEKEPNLTPEDLIDKIYQKVTKTLSRYKLIGGKAQKKSWDKIIEDLASQYDKPKSLVTELMVQHEGLVYKVVKHLSLYQTRAVPVWLWNEGIFLTKFTSIKEAAEITEIPLHAIRKMCDERHYYKKTKLQFTKSDKRPLPPNQNETQVEWALKLWRSLRSWLRVNTLPPNTDKALEALIQGYSISSASQISGIKKEVLEKMLETGIESISNFGKKVL